MGERLITKEGAEKLAKELDRYKNEERPKIIEAISVAREHGDLRENAEYHEARRKQGFIEGKIRELEVSLMRSQVIDTRAIDAGGRVVFGATVYMQDSSAGEPRKFQIVGQDEINIEEGKIPVDSPMASALIGKREDDQILVKTPSGERTYTVIKVRYS